MPRSLILIAATTLTMIAFAANSVINRAALLDGSIGPISFSVLRLWFGVAVLAIFVLIRAKGRIPRPEFNPKGVAGLMAYMLGFSLAYVSMDAGLGALILFGGVQITMFIGAILRGQRPVALQWVGTGVAFGGLAYLLWPTGAFSVPIGAALAMVAAAIGWGVYSLVGGQARDPVLASCTSFLVSAVLILPIWGLLANELITTRGVLLAALSGAITSGLFYPLWYWVLPQLKITTAAVAQLTVPAIAMLGGMIFLAEPLSLRFLVASVIILGGIAISIWAKETG